MVSWVLLVTIKDFSFPSTTINTYWTTNISHEQFASEPVLSHEFLLNKSLLAVHTFCILRA